MEAVVIGLAKLICNHYEPASTGKNWSTLGYKDRLFYIRVANTVIKHIRQCKDALGHEHIHKLE